MYTFHPGFLTDPSGSNKNNSNYDFQWEDSQLLESNYCKAIDLMFRSLDIIIKYAQEKNISIAIESEGSLNKKDVAHSGLQKHP